MLAVTVIKNTVTKRLWNFQIRFLPYSNTFEKNFFSKHVLLSFSSTLSPRSYLENACCNRYQNTVTKRLWNFQIRFLPYSNTFEKIFFSKHVLSSFSSTLSPRSYLENACCNRYQKHVTKRFWNFQIRFLPYSNAFEKIFFPNMFFYHFFNFVPEVISQKLLAVTVIKNTVTKRLWNFQIRFLPCSNTFEKKFFFQTCSFIIFFNFVPEVISRKCLL